jgi:hypothetical protein
VHDVGEEKKESGKNSGRCGLCIPKEHRFRPSRQRTPVSFIFDYLGAVVNGRLPRQWYRWERLLLLGNDESRSVLEEG